MLLKPTTKTSDVVVPPMLHARWIQYRLLAGDSDKALRASLNAHDLPCPDATVLKAIRKSLAVPKGFRLGARNKSTIDYLTQRQLLEFAQETPAAKEACEILETPRVRELVEVASLVSAPKKDLFMALERLHVAVSPESITQYRLAFFDPWFATRAQLRLLVAERVELGLRRVMPVEDDSKLRKIVATDPRILALTLNESRLAFYVALMRAGYPPAHLSLPRVISELESAASLRAAESLFVGGRNAIRNAEGCTQVLRNLQQVRQMIATPDDALNTLRVQLLHDQRPLRSLQEVAASTGGTWTDGTSEIVHSAN